MKVFYSPYRLTPLKIVNRLSSKDEKRGVFLKGTLNNEVMFADYFPHLPLGDREVDDFLQGFKFQEEEEEYDRKVLELLLKDQKFQRMKAKTFFNHQLWEGIGEIASPVVKYKIKTLNDLSFLYPLKNGIRVRLDANGLFDRESFRAFLDNIPVELRELIDYIEDPIQDTVWKEMGLPTARDFIEGNPSDFVIYKPNCEFKPPGKKVIYSSYLGADFGKWHSYAELCFEGDLSLTHGIVTEGFYQEERSIFQGSYKTCFLPDHQAVRSLYQDLAQREWKSLCSI
jgi:hypothetical protein